MAAFLARVPGHQHGADGVEPGHGDGAPADEHHHGRRAGGGHAPDEFLLVSREPEARAVAELPLLDAGHHDGHRAPACQRDGAVEPSPRRLLGAGVPHQAELRVARGLVELEPEGVRAPRGECHLGEPRAGRALLPGVEQEPAVEPEAPAVGAVHAEPRHPVGPGGEGAAPADRVPVGAEAGRGGRKAPAHVHRGVAAHRGGSAREVGVAEELRRERHAAGGDRGVGRARRARGPGRSARDRPTAR